MNTKDSKLWGLKLASVLGGAKIDKGGPGSGHFGHAGRPGEVGGSVPTGVRVGRYEAGSREEQFKWSGSATMGKRARGPSVRATLVKDPRSRNFEVHGAVDHRGKPKRGKCVIRSNGDAIELDHEELHDLRSKMRYVKMINDRGVSRIAGEDIAQGNAIDVEVGGKKVRVPVNEETVREINRASQATRRKGYSYTGESKRQVKQAFDRMQREHPIQAVKDMGFSESGKAAALRVYVDGPGTSRREMERLVESKRGLVGRTVMYELKNVMREFFTMRRLAWRARELSDTAAAEYYQWAAAYRSRIQKAGQRKKRS